MDDNNAQSNANANDTASAGGVAVVRKGVPPVKHMPSHLEGKARRHWFVRLFLQPKFVVHRVFGLAYLLQWAAALLLYFVDYPSLVRSPLVWSLPLTGLTQSLTATYYFWFLPKKSDPGYYSDRSSLSISFVKENIFFAGLLLFQWVYFTDRFFVKMQNSVVLLAFENIFVFLPYAFRPLFPKTSFRDSLYNDKNKSTQNYDFFFVSTWITKIFYLWAKHFIGLFLNYVRFLDRVTAEQQYHMYLLLIFSCFATTVSMFLHTLKFKRYIGPRLSFSIYMASYMATFYSFARMFSVLPDNLDLVLLAAAGMAINFGPSWGQLLWQAVLLVLLNLYRGGVIMSLSPLDLPISLQQLTNLIPTY